MNPSGAAAEEGDDNPEDFGPEYEQFMANAKK